MTPLQKMAALLIGGITHRAQGMVLFSIFSLVSLLFAYQGSLFPRDLDRVDFLSWRFLNTVDIVPTAVCLFADGFLPGTRRSSL